MDGQTLAATVEEVAVERVGHQAQVVMVARHQQTKEGMLAPEEEAVEAREQVATQDRV